MDRKAWIRQQLMQPLDIDAPPGFQGFRDKLHMNVSIQVAREFMDGLHPERRISEVVQQRYDALMFKTYVSNDLPF